MSFDEEQGGPRDMPIDNPPPSVFTRDEVVDAIGGDLGRLAETGSADPFEPASYKADIEFLTNKGQEIDAAAREDGDNQ